MKKTNLKKIKINNNLYLEEIDKDSYSNVYIKTGDIFHLFEDILIKLGYREVKSRLVSGGIASIYSGIK